MKDVNKKDANEKKDAKEKKDGLKGFSFIHSLLWLIGSI